jgi:hypothetical protein
MSGFSRRSSSRCRCTSALRYRRGNSPFYSLRHTYICLRLMEGADIYQIAKNCRTSVEMIEKFYAAHLKNMIDASAVNVRRVAAPAATSKRRANATRSKAARPIVARNGRK